ncbi:hypothetical protein ALNOE001_01120 [Candidatus Methanobinarius endosymbioticus]|uniref:T-Q ester bond containing domain-containing protein n=1 Tax=Candidatus Methanobinarius endosymbioticus TaxID=2006182 RepID=A0A366ME56_9EURY|nr:hypothetical protein ALNOE001_01120 [Candidatus Methanobinarius endosymbioticus]
MVQLILNLYFMGALADKTIVVFEKLFSNNTEITFHEDITDEEQTVSIKPEPPEAQPPEKETAISKAAVKSTGIPFMATLLSLFSIMGFIYNKKE